jgi:3-phenylpropionate/cinnamic acid dioxygenase small subunit
VSLVDRAVRGRPADAGTCHEVEQFLYDEAALLDDRCWDEWLALLADDLHYWMPSRSNRVLSDLGHAVAGPHEVAHFDDDLATMRARVRRLHNVFGWSENPPSRTRHLVTNVRVWQTDDPAELEVESAFLVYQSKHERDAYVFAGRRADCLRRTEGSWRIARRHILLDQTVVAQSLSILF